MIYKIWLYFENKRYLKEMSLLKQEFKDAKTEEEKAKIISLAYLLEHLSVSDFKAYKNSLLYRSVTRGMGLIEGYCGYCHDVAVMWCENEECDGNRKSVCKECAVTNNCRCADCGERFIDIAEIEY